MEHEHDPKHPEQSIDTTRRRLAKAGLAAPAVLGVLASRPVLANQFHHCTPSGHISGFASPNPNATSCNTLGASPDQWKTATWPSGFDKGVPGTPDIDPAKWKTVSAVSSGTRFNTVFADVFRYVPKLGTTKTCYTGDTLQNNGKCKTNTTPPKFYDSFYPVVGTEIITNTTDPRWNQYGVSPTLMQILQHTPSTNFELFNFAKAAIAVYLSATEKYPAFPVSPQQVIAMFNATYPGTMNAVYAATSYASWNRSEVMHYFQTLYT